MKTNSQPPGKRPAKDKPSAAPAATESNREPKEGRTDKERESADKPSEEEVISHWKNPVTNQDEQEKITNNGGEDLPVANN